MFERFIRILQTIALDTKNFFKKATFSERAFEFKDGGKPSEKTHKHNYAKKGEPVQKTERLDTTFEDISLKDHKHPENVSVTDVHLINGIRTIILDDAKSLKQLDANHFAPKDHKHTEFKIIQRIGLNAIVDNVSYLKRANVIKGKETFAKKDHKHKEKVKKTEGTRYATDLSQECAKCKHNHDNYSLYGKLKSKKIGINEANNIVGAVIKTNRATSFPSNKKTKKIQLAPRSVISEGILAQKIGLPSIFPTIKSDVEHQLGVTQDNVFQPILERYFAFVSNDEFYNVLDGSFGARLLFGDQGYREGNMHYLLLYTNSTTANKIRKLTQRRFVKLGGDIPLIEIDFPFEPDLIESQNKNKNVKDLVVAREVSKGPGWISWQELNQTSVWENIAKSINSFITTNALLFVALMTNMFNMLVCSIADVPRALASMFKGISNTFRTINFFGLCIGCPIADVFDGMVGALSWMANNLLKLLILFPYIKVKILNGTDELIIFEFIKKDELAVDFMTGRLVGETIVSASTNRVTKGIEVNFEDNFDEKIQPVASAFSQGFSTIQEAKNFIEELQNIQMHYVYYSINQNADITDPYFVDTLVFPEVNNNKIYLMRMFIPQMAKLMGFSVIKAEDKLIVNNYGIPTTVFLSKIN